MFPIPGHFYKPIALLSFMIVVVFTAKAQRKVANYAFGEPGTDKFELLGFNIDGKVTSVEYYYGKSWKQATLKYLGKTKKDGRTCIKVEFKNGYQLFISTDKLHLRVEDASGKYLKVFDWYYEGPRDGIGTFCEPCAEDEKQAMKWMLQYYFN